MNPAIEQLRRLCRLGFNGERLFNQDGHLDLVHYTRDVRGVRDVVLVYSEDQALAYRTRDTLDPDSPLHVTENAVEWRLHGDVVTVVNALLTPGPPPACAAAPGTPDQEAMNAPEQPVPPAAVDQLAAHRRRRDCGG